MVSVKNTRTVDTPYFKELNSLRESYSDEERERDIEGAKKLIAATVEILNSKCSFCHVIGKSDYNMGGER